MKKKLLSVILSVAMVASLLVGCGGSAGTSASGKASSDGGVQEITWMFWDDLDERRI